MTATAKWLQVRASSIPGPNSRAKPGGSAHCRRLDRHTAALRCDRTGFFRHRIRDVGTGMPQPVLSAGCGLKLACLTSGRLQSQSIDGFTNRQDGT